MSNKLLGQTVLVFGGNSGMGKSAAKFAMREGAKAWIIGRNKEKLEKAALEISPSDSSKVRTSVLDVEDEEAVSKFFGAIEAGSINHIVCTLGPGADVSSIIGKDGLAGIQKQFKIKFFAQLTPVAYGADKLADGGSIVLTSGALSRRMGATNTALSTANAALDTVAKGLANDLGPRIRVNTVSPGLTDTEMWSEMPIETKNRMLAGFGSLIPLKRAGTSDDVGDAIVFLLTNNYITGTTLDVDGGAVIRK